MTPEQQFKRFNRDLIDLIEKNSLRLYTPFNRTAELLVQKFSTPALDFSFNLQRS